MSLALSLFDSHHRLPVEKLLDLLLSFSSFVQPLGLLCIHKLLKVIVGVQIFFLFLLSVRYLANKLSLILIEDLCLLLSLCHFSSTGLLFFKFDFLMELRDCKDIVLLLGLVVVLPLVQDFPQLLFPESLLLLSTTSSFVLLH